MQNVSFCLDNLSQNDKVLSFTQQQIFFEPLFPGMDIVGSECGPIINTIDENCFENKMIQSDCKVVIYDYRTTFLKSEIQEKIKRNFVYSGAGQIFIPGLNLEPNEKIEKQLWVSGYYYSPNLNIAIDENKINENLLKLEKTNYTFNNLSDEPALLYYVFRPDLMEPKKVNASK
jgi:hypothetical protein